MGFNSLGCPQSSLTSLSCPSQRKPVCVDSGASAGAVTPWWRCHRGVPAEPEFTRFVLFLQLFTPGKGRGKCGRGWREIGPIPQRCLLFLPLPPQPRWEAKRRNLPGNMEFSPGFGVPGTGRTPDRTGDLFPLFPSVFSSRCSQPTPEFPVISPARRPSRIPPGHGMSRVPSAPAGLRSARPWE